MFDTLTNVSFVLVVCEKMLVLEVNYGFVKVKSVF